MEEEPNRSRITTVGRSEFFVTVLFRLCDLLRNVFRPMHKPARRQGRNSHRIALADEAVSKLPKGTWRGTRAMPNGRAF